ncbi:MAG: polysaccharide deacetylase family protein [Magnetococcales bacterium]|nr:polysaccharide deacetylase family protein [Magnetococcales bacterium]
MLTTVMYHYVRDIPNSRWPRLKGLLPGDFAGQLDFIQRHYAVCSPDRVLAAAGGGEPLPTNACLLTFDDGLADHYHTVLPMLLERGLAAGFYPIGAAVDAAEVMNVHKAHFILDAEPDVGRLLAETWELVERCREQYDLPERAELQRRCITGAARFDDAETITLKRLLQQALPRPVARRCADELFRRHVTSDERGFAEELYLSPAQIREMAAAGMGIGGHGYRHEWLEDLPRREQVEDLERTRDFLHRILGRGPEDWILTYPFGSCNRHTFDLLERLPGCRLAFISSPGLEEDFSRRWTMRRLDTNDLPRDGRALPGEWTRKLAA